MLASTIFEDEEVLAFDKQVRIVRLPVKGLEGRTLAEEQVRTTTGCTVVEIIREGESITEFDPSAFTFEADDHVIVAGTDEAITKFEHQFSL